MPDHSLPKLAKHYSPVLATVTLLAHGFVFTNPISAQQAAPLLVEHPDCTLFGPQREEFLAGTKQSYKLSALTNQVTRFLAPAAKSSGPKTAGSAQAAAPQGLIDKSLFQAMQDAGVTPAAPANDFEFIRRVTLDLTGRIPTAIAVQTFVNDNSPDKRSKLIDALLASPEWVDKWTMYYGDLFKNSSFKAQVNLYNEGRNAFYKWIRASLAANKPYDRMVREIIAAPGSNTWDPDTGQSNWIVGGRVTGGPLQDTQDQLTANVAETFLGVANLNCVLCHNGRGHLDSVNLWGKNTTRYQAWQMAAFMSHVNNFNSVRPNPANQNSYYWTWPDNLKTDYVLGSTTGNRPARPYAGAEKTIAPMYIFNGHTPKPGQDYRAALALEVTSDFQFARATVNYLWQQFFGRGFVEPANQFDLARLDPDNPPTDPSPQDPNQPWPLQPSNPRLLNALAQNFIDGGYDVKAFMRLMANSQAYQLSARYDPAVWNPQWESLFARKLVRRLWAEEIHDAIAQSSAVPGVYKIYEGQDPADIPGATVTLNWAMQLPETSSRGFSISTNAFLDAFLRGNRDDLPRKSEASLTQALDLMNDSFVMNRVRTASSGSASLLNSLLAAGAADAQLVSALYINVLSRYPTDAETQTAVTGMQRAPNRKAGAEDLLWSLYNKVDFIFNY